MASVYVHTLNTHTQAPHVSSHISVMRQGGQWISLGEIIDTFYTKIPIAPCYCQMMGQTLKEEIKITQYNNPTKAGKYSLEDLFRASDNIPHHYPKF